MTHALIPDIKHVPEAIKTGDSLEIARAIGTVPLTGARWGFKTATAAAYQFAGRTANVAVRRLTDRSKQPKVTMASLGATESEAMQAVQADIHRYRHLLADPVTVHHLSVRLFTAALDSPAGASSDDISDVLHVMKAAGASVDVLEGTEHRSPAMQGRFGQLRGTTHILHDIMNQQDTNVTSLMGRR